MCKACVSRRKFGGNYILHKQYLWRHNINHIKKKDISETKSDSIATSLGIVLTDNKPNITVNNDVVSDTINIVRTVDEHGSHDVNFDFVRDGDIVPDTLDIVRVQKNEDRLSTDRLQYPCAPLILSTGSDMENQVEDIYDNKVSYEYFKKKCIWR